MFKIYYALRETLGMRLGQSIFAASKQASASIQTLWKDLRLS
jgi:hypothetical protein